MLKRLELASREGHPMFGQSSVTLGSKLFESALGSIYFAKLLNSKSFVKEQSVILKTLDLKVQNTWAVTLFNKKTTLRNFSSSKVLFMHQDKNEAKEWLETWCHKFGLGRESALLCKIAWICEDSNRDGATKIMRLNEYLNEAMVGLILSKYLKVPHFVKTHDAWISNATGFILQDYGGENMLKKMIDLDIKDFQSIVVQVLVTLAVAQNALHFKHHDLHLENVFINRLKEDDQIVLNGQNVKLNSSEVWSYTLTKGLQSCESCTGEDKSSCGSDDTSEASKTIIYIEHRGLLARIADFGLSSITDPETCTRYERVDYGLLDSTEAEWGQWSGTLEDQKMYDAVVFLSKFFGHEESNSCSSENIEWARILFRELKTKWPEIECSNIGRPLRFQEGRASVSEIFTLPCLQNFLIKPKKTILQIL